MRCQPLVWGPANDRPIRSLMAEGAQARTSSPSCVGFLAGEAWTANLGLRPSSRALAQVTWGKHEKDALRRRVQKRRLQGLQGVSCDFAKASGTHPFSKTPSRASSVDLGPLKPPNTPPPPLPPQKKKANTVPCPPPQKKKKHPSETLPLRGEPRGTRSPWARCSSPGRGARSAPGTAGTAGCRSPPPARRARRAPQAQPAAEPPSSRRRDAETPTPDEFAEEGFFCSGERSGGKAGQTRDIHHLLEKTHVSSPFDPGPPGHGRGRPVRSR